MAKEQEDLREVIMKRHRDDSLFPNINEVVFSKAQVREMLDEYADNRMDQLLDYMVKHGVDCDAPSAARSEGRFYWFEGKWITKAELFQNFL